MRNILIKFALFVFILLSGSNIADAVIQGWVPPDNYGESDSYEIGIDSNDEIDGTDQHREELSMEDIFGSEQVFPFPPGLGN